MTQICVSFRVTKSLEIDDVRVLHQGAPFTELLTAQDFIVEVDVRNPYTDVKIKQVITCDIQVQGISVLPAVSAMDVELGPGGTKTISFPYTSDKAWLPAGTYSATVDVIVEVGKVLSITTA